MVSEGADRTSRYGDAKPKDFTVEHDIAPEEVAGVVKDMRAVFATERTYSVEWRKQQLRQFKKMIVECEQEMCAAMKTDLHKSGFEGFCTELGLVVSEIDVAISHLDQWMTPNKTSNSALNIPCWSTTQHDPLGVVLVMGAWNYPMQLSLCPMVGALAGGNCVILKPGSYAVSSSNCLARIVKKYLDPECVRVIEGNRKITSALLEQRFDKIFFTGSGYVGRIVLKAAAEHLTPCVLELGGKSPSIIDRSANLQHCVDRLIWGTFLNSGQTCVRPDFVMVHADVADDFFKLVQKTVVKFYGENPQKTEWFGRLINDAAFTRLSKLVNEHADHVVIGGQLDGGDKYISPTVFDFGTDIKAFSETSIMRDELFGPLLPCVRYTNFEDVIKFVRDLHTGKPLALYAFGTDAKFIADIKARTTSGGLVINDCLMHLGNHELPFGGVGASGMGNYHGEYSFKSLTHEKAVLEKSPAIDESILMKPLLQARFPPYTKSKQMLVRLFGTSFSDTLVNLAMPALRTLFKILAIYLIFRKLGFKIVRE
mmetsp:Transcript_5264/g.8082  ORF Transcript_5264/g.8082 Transcript_5264/m.8082 type:complete len:539 (+) Transcript_5264:130-1746(+)